MTDPMSNDEIRRQLREADAAHREAMPLADEAMKQAFGDGGAVPAEAKAELLGVPSRRRLFRLGGSAVLGAAVLAACTKTGDPKEQLAQTGTTPTTAKADASKPAGSYTDDLTLLRTAQSIEVLAVDTYQKAIAANGLLTGSLLDTIKLFQSQHQDHAGLIERTTKDLGGEPYTQPNPVLSTAIQESVNGLSSSADVVKLAKQLESIAAETYVYSSGILTTEALRQAIMSIGAVEGRHITVLIGYSEPNQPLVQVPFAFIRTADAVKLKGEASKAVGPGKVPDRQPATTTTVEATTATTTGGTGTTKAGSTGTTAKK